MSSSQCTASCPTSACRRENGQTYTCKTCQAAYDAQALPAAIDVTTPEIGAAPLGWMSQRYYGDEPRYLQMTSPCGRYVARWWDRNIKRPELKLFAADAITVEMPHPDPLFVLRRNSYHLDMCLFAVYFFPHPTTGETLMLYNPKHGQLRIVNMRNEVLAQQKEGDRDFFIFDLLRTSADSPRRVLIDGWVWHPALVTWYLNLDTLLAVGDAYRMMRVIEEDDGMNGKVCSRGVYQHSFLPGAEDEEREGDDAYEPLKLPRLLTWDKLDGYDPGETTVSVNNLYTQMVQSDGSIVRRAYERGDARCLSLAEDGVEEQQRRWDDEISKIE